MIIFICQFTITRTSNLCVALLQACTLSFIFQVLPHLEANIYKIPKCTDSNCNSKKNELKHSVPSVTELANLCAAWVQGAISNFDYLTALNKLAGRRYYYIQYNRDAQSVDCYWPVNHSKHWIIFVCHKCRQR